MRRAIADIRPRTSEPARDESWAPRRRTSDLGAGSGLAGLVLLMAAMGVAIGCHSPRDSSETWSTWSSADSAPARVDSAAGDISRRGPGNATPATNASNSTGAAAPAVAPPPRVLPPRAEPELPRVSVDTRYVPPSGGRRLVVRRGENLQSALDAAQSGDVVLLEPGATFVGNFTLPEKSGTGWITVRTAAPDAQLPAEGARITPAYGAVLPKVVTPNGDPALATALRARRYRILGIELTVAPSVTRNHGIVTLGEGGRSQSALDRVASQIIVDRSYVHGHPTLNVNRCIALNSASSAVIDSYLSECHAKGFDSQAICGWNGPGPFKITNNYLEGAGEIVMFGGADPFIANLTPSDIEIKHNHFRRPPSWKGVWTVKNLLELKQAQRVLVEGNVLENHWADAQDGFAIVWFSVNQDGRAPWSVVRDVTFRYNRVRNAGGGINIAAGTPPVVPASRIKVVDNVFENLNVAPFTGHGKLFQVLADLDNVTIDHNTTFTPSVALMFDVMPQRTNFSFSNNVTTRGEYGIAGSDFGEGLNALNHYLAPGYRVEHNVLIGPDDKAAYPAKNFFAPSVADVGFVNFASGNYRLAKRSRFKKAGSDGRDPGADLDAIESATRGVVVPETGRSQRS